MTFIGASPIALALSAADNTVLSLKNVQVLYDRAIEAVRDVSLDVPAGAIVALLGSNGAGKSTILKAISGVLEQEDGEIVNGSVHLDSAQISGRSPCEIVRAGLLQVPEARALFATLTVEENLQMGGFTRARAECAETIEQIYTLFPRVKERRSQISGYLSGGEQQMVAVGRALMGRPRVLMLVSHRSGSRRKSSTRSSKRWLRSIATAG